MTNDTGGVEMDFDEFDASLAQAESELRWADALLDGVYEFAFLPDLVEFACMFTGASPTERYDDYLLRLRKFADGYRVHGYAGVVWDGVGWSPTWGIGYIYPDLRDAVDHGLPAAMAAHTDVVHQMLTLKAKARQNLLDRMGVEDE